MTGVKSFIKTVAAWVVTSTIAGLIVVTITVYVIKDQVITLQRAVTRIEHKMDTHLIQHTRIAEGTTFKPIKTKGYVPSWRAKKNQRTPARSSQR